MTPPAFLTGGPIATGDEVVRRLARTVHDYLTAPAPEAVSE
ncbi:hypothetical protein AB0873_05230 [Micromonospora sp. NPDC047707]